MENFIVSARKYRPTTFDSVVGQAHITTTLKNAILNQHLAHAFLFCGPRGVGKTTCARILAKTINCTNITKEGEACNQCESCVSFEKGASLNIHELDAASNNSVDDIRTLVEQVRFAPQAGKYKVYIVDEVHMLSASAFNAFLKTLEEPPAHAIFILATTEKHKIIPTILSRCQIFDFKRITSKTTDYHISISNKMPPAAYILTPGRISVIPEADRKDFKGDFVHLGGWLTIHADNTCEIYLMDAFEAENFTNTKNDKLVSLANEDPKAVKWIEKIRSLALKNFFRPGM